MVQSNMCPDAFEVSMKQICQTLCSVRTTQQLIEFV